MTLQALGELEGKQRCAQNILSHAVRPLHRNKLMFAALTYNRDLM